MAITQWLWRPSSACSLTPLALGRAQQSRRCCPVRSPQAIGQRKPRPRDIIWDGGCAFPLTTWTVAQRTQAPQLYSQLGSHHLTLKGQTSAFRDPWQKGGGILPRGRKQGGTGRRAPAGSCQSRGAQPGSSGPGPLLKAAIARGWQHGAAEVDPPLGGWLAAERQLSLAETWVLSKLLKLPGPRVTTDSHQTG